LRDFVMAANEDKSIPAARLKIGHIDPRFNDQQKYDGTPAFGKLDNLRLDPNGMSIYADFVGVPAWLADIMETAYPSRSVEVFWDVESQKGKVWRGVISACSILGVVWPGITVLEDLPMYYGQEVPPGVVIDPLLVAASNQPGGDPMRLFGRSAAAANLDDVRRKFYRNYIPENDNAANWWIMSVLTDPNQLVIEDDESGQLFMMPYSSDTSGSVSFGDAVPVRLDIERSGLGSPPPAADPPVTPQSTTTDPPAPDPAPEPTPDPAPEPTAQVIQLPVAASGATPPGMVMVDSAMLDQIRQDGAAARQYIQTAQASHREGVVMAAISAGKIPPARKDAWVTYLENDPQGGEQMLNSMASILPVQERGHAGTGLEEQPAALEEATVQSWTDNLFPEVRNTRAQAMAAASGQFVPRNRITNDGTMVRGR
jgi:hypothetical protein